MTIEYLIINNQTNQVVDRFAISWLRDYTNSTISQVCSSNLMEMVEYCRKEIQLIEENLARIQFANRVKGIKEEIIENIQTTTTRKELYDILKYSIYLVENDNEDEDIYFKNLLEKFQYIENKIISYVISDEKLYLGEVSV